MTNDDAVNPDEATSQRCPPWTTSNLVKQIIAALRTPQPLKPVAENLGVTDARVLFYLERLQSLGWMAHDGDQWHTTDAAPIQRQLPAKTQTTTLPFPSAQDYEQAYDDAAVGMFGADYVQMSGEHAGRVPQERIEEFNRRLNSLINEYFSPEAIDRTASPKYGFRWVLTPVDLHPLNDQ